MMRRFSGGHRRPRRAYRSLRSQRSGGASLLEQTA
jgi:hypothetical protein